MAAVPFNLVELLKEGLIQGLVGHKLAESLDANFAAITGGGGGTLPIVNGGTGATSAGAARANLGLGALAVLNTINNTLWSGAPLTVANLDTTGLGTALGLGSLALLNSVNNAQWSGTALALTNGGTGATTAVGARTALGLATVAATGAYADLSGLPTLGSLAALSSINNSNWSGTVLSVANGGTGAATLTSHGVLIGSGTAAVTATATGTAGQVLTSNGASADPTWQNQASVGGTVPTGGTGLTSVAAHGMLVGNGTSAFTVVGPGTSGYVWTSNGGSTDPSWQAAASSGGTVPTGGTGLTTVVKGGLLSGNGTSALTIVAPGTSGLFLKANGAGADPSWASASRAPGVYFSDYATGTPDTTDNTTQLTAAVAAWMAAAFSHSPWAILGDLYIDLPCYIAGSTIDVIPSATASSYGGRIKFINGAFIRGSAGQYALHFAEHSTTVPWGRIEVVDASLINCGLRFENLADSFPLGQIKVTRAYIQATSGTITNHAISLEGVFESVIEDCIISWSSGAGSGSCINIGSSATVFDPSSNTLRNNITRNGQHGVYAPGYGNSIVMESGTHLESLAEAVYIEGYGFKAFGVHVENACQTSGQAGMIVIGSGSIYGLEGRSDSGTPSSQKYALEVHGHTVVVDGLFSSDIAGWKFLLVDGSSDSSVTICGDVSNSMTYDVASGYQGKISTTQQRIVLPGVNANTTFTVPAGYAINSITFDNTAANAVTGGVRIGTTAGAQDVLAAGFAIGASAFVRPTAAQLLKEIFTKSAAQICYLQAVTSWNSASVNVIIDIEYARN